MAVYQSTRPFTFKPCPCRNCRRRRQHQLRSALDAFYAKPAEPSADPQLTWMEVLRGLIFTFCFAAIFWSLSCL
jgi:hypothetical protein